MAAARIDHHRKKAEDDIEGTVISCDYAFLTHSKVDERQLTYEGTTAVGATPIFVVRDKLNHETTIKWILGHGYEEVFIKTDGERSVVVLGRKVTEKLNEACVEAEHQSSPAYDSRSAGQAEIGVRIVREGVPTLVCSASCVV